MKREKELNRLLSETQTEDQAVESLIYLTNKARHGGTTTEANIRKAYKAGTLGTLLKRLDPTAFYVN